MIRVSENVPTIEPEPCEDAISRKYISDKLRGWMKHDGYSCGELNMMNCVLQEVEDAPSVQPERKRGEWRLSIDNGYSMYECSVCESRMWKTEYDKAVGTHGFRFCPYCGAYMRGGGSDE